MRKDYSILNDLQLSTQEKRRYLSNLAKRANERLLNLEKAGYTNTYAYQFSSFYIENEMKRNKNLKTRFKTSYKKASDYEVDIAFSEIINFLGRESSTITGAQKRKEVVEKAVNTMVSNGIIDSEKKNNFVDFLNSKQFYEMKKYIDSKQILDDYAESIDAGLSKDQIEYLYSSFLESNMSLSDIKKRRDEIKVTNIRGV